MSAVVKISFPVKHLVWIFLAAMLSACGGGGSEPSAPGANGSQQQPPSLYVPEPGTATVGELFTLQLAASDVNGDKLTFSVEGRPSWATFDEKKGTLSGRPGNSDGGRSHNVRFGVSDGTSLTESDPVEIVVEPVSETPPPDPNQAPSISGSPATTVIVGSAYRFQPQASDPEGDTLTFAIRNLPTWASFNSTNGVLSGTPGSAAVGTTSAIEISVSDGEFSVSLAPFSIQVNAQTTPTVNTAPVISGNPATSVAEGSAYSYTPAASDADGDSLLFSIQNLPIWANFNSATGTLSGIPSGVHVGIYTNILISVSDGQATTAGASFSIQVLSTNRAPTLTGTPASSVTSGQAYTFQPSASDPDGDTLSFTIENRPLWASFNSANGALTGTPQASDVADYANIRISVSDGEATTRGSAFSISVVSANRAPTLTGTPAASVNAGQAYAFQPTASDADGDTLSYSIENLPSWASFNNTTGALTGTPAESHVGLYSNVRISVSDGEATTRGTAFSIDVTQVSLGNATLSWTAPTENMDGSALTDLVGYKLYYGVREGEYTEEIQIENPGIVTYVVENLSPNTYYFVATAYNVSGVESPFSGVAVKVVN